MENDDYNDKLDNFKQDEKTFSQIINSQKYKKINDIRTQLLMKIDKEVSKYLKNKIMINSITPLNYLKYIFPNMTINLKSQHITSSNENEISFSYIFSKCKSDETKINHFESFPFLFNYHHYRQFKKKKKFIIAKNSCNNAKLDSNTCLLSPNSIDYYQSPNREKHLFELTKKLRKKTYFNYLHSLFFSIHKNKTKDKSEGTKFESMNLKNFSKMKQNKKNKRNSSIHLIKIKRKLLNDKNDIKELKKSSSNDDIFTSNIIKLIKCKKM